MAARPGCVAAPCRTDCGRWIRRIDKGWLYIWTRYWTITTMTTIGYGDVSPVTSIGQVVLIIHIAIGYLGLGALLSILANKFASRGN